MVPHKRRCLFGIIFCPKCPNFSARLQVDFNFHLAKKHNFSNAKEYQKGQFCHQVFPGFYALRLDKQKVHDAQNGPETKLAVVTQLMREVHYETLKEELETCKRFLLDSKMENGRHRFFNFVMELLHAHTLIQKTRHSVREAQVCCRVVGWIWRGTQTRTTLRWNDQNVWQPNKVC